jgi:hypothetical protein
MQLSDNRGERQIAMRHPIALAVFIAVPVFAFASCAAQQEALDAAAPQAGAEHDASVAVMLEIPQELPAANAEPSLMAVANARAPEPAHNEACPQGMVLIDGDFCPKVEQRCVTWMEDPVKFPYARCAEFAEPSECKGERVHMRFCMDKLEAGDKDSIPVGDVSWTYAADACKSQGKRLCKESEWVFACEGEEMRPYPYGYVRNPQICNFERDGLMTEKGELTDFRQPVTSNPHCLSPWGIQNMVGNIDEWVALDRPHYSAVNGGRKMMSGLKGGWWGPLRNRCRPTTVDHDEYFHELQTGYRCCSEAGT